MRLAGWDAGDIQLVAGFLHKGFGAPRFGWRHEYAVWSVGDIFLGTEDADVGFNLVVVGREFLVGDGPVVAQSVGGVGTKISWAKSERDASPMVCSASLDA